MNFIRRTISSISNLSSNKQSTTKTLLKTTNTCSIYIIDRSTSSAIPRLEYIKESAISLITGTSSSIETNSGNNRTTTLYNNGIELRYHSKTAFSNLLNYLNILKECQYFVKYEDRGKQIFQTDIFFTISFEKTSKNDIYTIQHVKNQEYDQYIIKSVAKAIKFLHSKNLCLNNFTLQSLKITFHGFIKIGDLDEISSSTRSKLQKDESDFSKLCSQILGEGEFTIDEFLDSDSNIIERTESILKESDTLSFKHVVDLLNSTNFKNLNSQLKNKIIIVCVSILLSKSSKQVDPLKKNDPSAQNAIKSGKTSKKSEISSDSLKKMVQPQKIPDFYDKRTLIFIILEMYSPNLTDYLEILFNIRDNVFIDILLKNQGYYFLSSSDCKKIGTKIEKNKISCIEATNPNNSYRNLIKYNYKSLIEWKLEIVEIILELQKNKKHRDSASNLLISIFPFLNPVPMKHCIIKIEKKDFIIEIFKKYLFIILDTVPPENYSEIIGVYKTEKDLRKMPLNRLAMNNQVKYKTKEVKILNQAFTKTLIPLLNTNRLFQQSLLLLFYSYKFIEEGVLITDILPLLCRTLRDGSDLHFFVLESILYFIKSNRSGDSNPECPSPMSFILGASSVPIDSSLPQSKISKKGQIDDEGSDCSMGNLEYVRDEIEKVKKKVDEKVEKVNEEVQKEPQGVQKMKNVKKRTEGKSNRIFNEESDEVSF